MVENKNLDWSKLEIVSIDQNRCKRTQDRYNLLTNNSEGSFPYKIVITI